MRRLFLGEKIKFIIMSEEKESDESPAQQLNSMTSKFESIHRISELFSFVEVNLLVLKFLSDTALYVSTMEGQFLYRPYNHTTCQICDLIPNNLIISKIDSNNFFVFYAVFNEILKPIIQTFAHSIFQRFQHLSSFPPPIPECFSVKSVSNAFNLNLISIYSNDGISITLIKGDDSPQLAEELLSIKPNPPILFVGNSIVSALSDFTKIFIFEAKYPNEVFDRRHCLVLLEAIKERPFELGNFPFPDFSGDLYPSEVLSLLTPIFNDFPNFPQFIDLVRKGYNNIPYHNFFHAMNVLQIASQLFEKSQTKQYFTDMEKRSFSVACILHDIGHPGLSNPFVMKSHPLKFVLPTSPLETFHCVESIRLFSNTQFDELFSWEIVTSLILSTDPSKYTSKKEFLKAKKHGINFSDPIERIELLSVFVEAADLGNAFSLFESSTRWAARVFVEQNRMDSSIETSHSNFLKLQIDFVTKVCLSFFETLSETIPSLSFTCEKLHENLRRWEKCLNL